VPSQFAVLRLSHPAWHGVPENSCPNNAHLLECYKVFISTAFNTTAYCCYFVYIPVQQNSSAAIHLRKGRILLELIPSI
jgi:hypothetical protein